MRWEKMLSVQDVEWIELLLILSFYEDENIPKMAIDEVRLRLYKHFLKVNSDITVGALEILVQNVMNRKKDEREGKEWSHY